MKEETAKPLSNAHTAMTVNSIPLISLPVQKDNPHAVTKKLVEPGNQYKSEEEATRLQKSLSAMRYSAVRL